MKISGIIVLILMFCIISSNSFAQENQFFDAKEGWKATGSKYNEFNLMAITMVFREENISSIDMDKGLANAWMYLYRNKSDTNQQKLLYITKNDDYIIDELDETINIPPGVFDLDDGKWFGSVEFFNKLHQNTNFTKYLAEHHGLSYIMLWFSYIPDDGNVPYDYSNKFVWGINLNHDFNCYTDAITGETHCDDLPTSVPNVNNFDNITISPNPASDFIEINIPPFERMLGGVSESVKVYNVLGECVLFLEDSRFRGNDRQVLRLDVSGLPAGVYFVRVAGRMLKFVKM